MKSFLRAAASLIILLIAISASAETWTSIQKQFLSAKSHDEAVANISKSKELTEDPLRELLSDYESATTKAAKDSTYHSIKQFLAANALSEQFGIAPNAASTAKAIKKDPIYTAQKEVVNSNWIQKLLERLKHLFDRESKDTTETKSPPPDWILPLIRGLFYVVCAAIIVLIGYLLTKIPWGWTTAGRTKKRKRGGMLEEGEELLSEDEYLLDADRLIAEGKYREACRALYLASLLRIDKSRIARFEPAQTNWEHLRRIETSIIRPENLQFRPVTKAFDLAWYGYRAKALEDVMIFRETYLVIKSLTEGMV
jgi:hypothetical protein